MKHRFRFPAIVASLIVALAMALFLPSCGTTHGYWGVHNDYYYQEGSHHKPPKYKKYKKYKKHKKNKHRHHHDHDDDDD